MKIDEIIYVIWL